MPPRLMRAEIRRGCATALCAAVLAPLIAACGSSGTAPHPAQVDLTVTLDPGVPTGGATQTWQVACPSPAHTAACARILAATEAFTPPPPDTACTLIYGGPEILTVTGSVGTRHVDYRTGRTNGCEIADYVRDLALVAPFRPAGLRPSAHSAA
jgi:hypothetical protein